MMMARVSDLEALARCTVMEGASDKDAASDLLESRTAREGKKEWEREAGLAHAPPRAGLGSMGAISHAGGINSEEMPRRGLRYPPLPAPALGLLYPPLPAPALAPSGPPRPHEGGTA